jgi:hypothetical protein
MSFFNRKEEVMEIQLTAYGKELLSKGKFKPAYYSFFDEGILYDGTRAGLSEIQNNVQYRIKNETPYLKDISNYLSSREIANRGELVPAEIDAREIPMFDFDSTYENQLGASSNNKSNAPAWAVSSLQSTFTSSLTYLTASSSSRRLQIPQLDVDPVSIRYTTQVVDADEDMSDKTKCEIDNLVGVNSGIFPDGTQLKMEEGVIFLKIREENSLNLKDNFEIELFEVKEITGSIASATKTKILKPLKFFKFKPQIQNGIMIDDGFGFENMENLDKIDETFASNYLEISVDDGVDQEKACELDEDRRRSDLFVKELIDCDIKKPYREAEVYEALGDGDIDEFIDSEDCD